jgi:hypothetical protein
MIRDAIVAPAAGLPQSSYEHERILNRFSVELEHHPGLPAMVGAGSGG